MNRDIGGPRSVVAHFRDPTERVPPFPVHGSNACAKQIAASPESLDGLVQNFVTHVTKFCRTREGLGARVAPTIFLVDVSEDFWLVFAVFVVKIAAP
jgi:hypothetical protein